jgi:hypothetical protein
MKTVSTIHTEKNTASKTYFPAPLQPDEHIAETPFIAQAITINQFTLTRDNIDAICKC